MEKATVATAGWATDAAQSRFENILASYYADGTQLDAVLASNDSTAQGVANALASSYTGEYPVLTGQDCDIVSVQNIIAGKQSMSLFKDTRILADKTVEMVDAIMKGAEPPVNNETDYDNGTGIIPSYLWCWTTMRSCSSTSVTTPPRSWASNTSAICFRIGQGGPPPCPISPGESKTSNQAMMEARACQKIFLK